MVDVTLADSPAEYSKYSGWPELKESFMAGKVKAAYLLAPMVMDLDSRNAGNRYDLVVAGMFVIGVAGFLLDRLDQLIARS